MKTEDLKILLALEPKWTVSLNGLEFLTMRSSDITLEDSAIRVAGHFRRIVKLEWLRPNVVRIQGRSKFRTGLDAITLYAGERLPSAIDLQRRRRAFQVEIGRALCSYFGVRRIERHMRHSDRQHGIGGAYPRFLAGGNAVIAVDPDESSAVINGLMRASLLWAALVHKRVVAVVPAGRKQTICSRLRMMAKARRLVQWLEWDGVGIIPLQESTSEPVTDIQEFAIPDVAAEVDRICSLAPELLQPVPHIAGNGISVRLRGIEIARVSAEGTTYPLGEPLSDVIREIAAVRREGHSHPLSRAHEERWLESNLIREIRQLLPFVDARYIYPQVPSFVGEERSIIDLLTVTKEGRLVIIEIKASADPELPFQALDYWIAVERHRKAGDFRNKGYFAGCELRNEPALLVLVAPLLAYHRTAHRLISFFPDEVPVTEIGINQRWKGQIRILRRRGMLG